MKFEVTTVPNTPSSCHKEHALYKAGTYVSGFVMTVFEMTASPLRLY